VNRLRSVGSIEHRREPLHLEEVLVACALLATTLAILPGERFQVWLHIEFGIKTGVGLVAAVVLCTFWQLAYGVRASSRLTAVEKIACLLAGILACCYAVSSLRDASIRGSADSLLRSVLPGLFVIAVLSGRPHYRALAIGLCITALTLATLCLLECLAHLRFHVPRQIGPAATLVNRNNVAFQISLAFPVLLYEFLHASSLRRSLAYVGGIVIVAMGLIVCRSRTAALATLCGSVLVFLLRDHRSVRGIGSVILRALSAFLAAALAFVCMTLIEPLHGMEPLADRFSRMLDLHDPAMLERYEIYRDSAALVFERPLTGWGAGNFAAARLARFPAHNRFLDDHPHNDLLGTAVEAGIPAAVALALFLGVLVYCGSRHAWRSGGSRLGPLAALFCVHLVLGFTNAPLLLAPSALCFWLIVACFTHQVGRASDLSANKSRRFRFLTGNLDRQR